MRGETVLTAVLALVLGGCVSSGSGEAGVPLAGTSWRVVEIAGAPPAPNTRPSVAFGADGRVSGQASCNRFSGGYRVDGAQIQFSQLVSTKMGCAGPVNEQETRFLRLLESASSHSRAGERLEIVGDGGRIVLAPDEAAARTVRFQCPDGDRLTVVFEEDSARLTDPQGCTFTLAQRPAASGIHYEGEGHVLRGKGQELTWTFARMAPRICNAID